MSEETAEPSPEEATPTAPDDPDTSSVPAPAAAAAGSGSDCGPERAAAPGAPHVQEISQQNIKNRLNEVITEIEREVEHELAGDEPEEGAGDGLARTAEESAQVRQVTRVTR